MLTFTALCGVALLLLGVVKRIARGRPLSEEIEERNKEAREMVKKYIADEDKCPECGAQWKGDDIYECFLKMKAEGHEYYKNKTDEEIRESAGMYGWTEEEPRFFRHIIGVELEWDHPQHYDGVSYWMCPGCKATWNRFTGQREEIPPNPNREEA